MVRRDSHADTKMWSWWRSREMAADIEIKRGEEARTHSGARAEYFKALMAISEYYIIVYLL